MITVAAYIVSAVVILFTALIVLALIAEGFDGLFREHSKKMMAKHRAKAEREYEEAMRKWREEYKLGEYK